MIKRQGSGLRETFTVRKQSFGVGVERTFPVHSPKIERIEVAARGDVRRAKLYYLRDRVGRGARVRERRWTGAASKRRSRGRDAAGRRAVPGRGRARGGRGAEADEADAAEPAEGRGAARAAPAEAEAEADGGARRRRPRPRRTSRAGDAAEEPDESRRAIRGRASG